MSYAGQLNFFDTVGLSPAELAEMQAKCNTQEKRIIEIMSDGRQYSPFDVMHEYNKLYPAVPITSIRRAMTCLTINQGFLIKCERMKMGDYNMKNHTWSIKKVL